MQEEGTYGSVLPQGQSLCCALSSALSSALVFFFGPVFVVAYPMMAAIAFCLCSEVCAKGGCVDCKSMVSGSLVDGQMCGRC